VVDTVKALEMGAVETLIVWENLAVTRYHLQSNNPEKSDPVLFLRPDQETDKKFFVDEVCFVVFCFFCFFCFFFFKKK
jgi:peptide chain release factor subunit 1